MPYESCTTKFSLPEIPAEEMTPTVRALLAIIEGLNSKVGRLEQQLSTLQAEVTFLKRHPRKPKFKGSNLDKAVDRAGRRDDEEPPASGRRAGSDKRSTLAETPVHETRIVSLAFEQGWAFAGYRDFLVRDIKVEAFNTLVRRQVWRKPDGTYVAAALPAEYGGQHFGPGVRALVPHLHHQCQVTHPLLREALREWGVDVSAGQVNALLTHGMQDFSAEKLAVLVAGLKSSTAITVDDTSARHKGVNGYVTNVSSPAFAWFESTPSKSRLSFLKLLGAAVEGYRINDAALRYMASHGLSPQLVAQLRGLYGATTDLALFDKLLDRAGVLGQDNRRTVTEGAVWGALQAALYSELAVVSDGASQFDVGQHGTCWVHAERLLHQLIPGSDAQRAELDVVRDEVWALYGWLKAYQRAPEPGLARTLQDWFDELFTRQTTFPALNEQLGRLHERKDKLLLVLRRPDAPLHTNQSENDIRCYVIKRKVSGGTRSDLGRTCRDTFTSLKKTCRKLEVSFWHYLVDRIGGLGEVMPLGELVKSRADELAQLRPVALAY